MSSTTIDAQVLTLDPGLFTDVTPAIHADNALVSNLVATATVNVYPDKTDTTKVITVAGKSERNIAAPFNHMDQRARFEKGVVAFSLKPASGTGPVTVVFT